MTDPRLGYIHAWDLRNDNFLASAILKPEAYETPRSIKWNDPKILDQGQTSSCVGNACAAFLMTEPKPTKPQNEAFAQKIYHLAQTIDGIPGAHQGTTVNAGVRATKRLKKKIIGSHRWIKTIDEALAWLSWHGPLVVGFNWYSKMFTPDHNGFIHVDGDLEGGHSFEINELNIEGDFVKFANSWGIGWGERGYAKIAISDLKGLINQQGENEVCGVVKI